MTDNAPIRSLRPLMRPSTQSVNSPVENSEDVAYRNMQRALAEQLANLELRVDMQPYLRDDPLARLGFDPEQIDYFSPTSRTSAAYFPEGAGDMSNVLGRQGYNAYTQMYPERNGSLPADTILMNSARPPASLRHESAHRGMEILRQLGILPEWPSYMGIAPLEEQIIEHGDRPYLEDTQNIPANTREFSQGARTMQFGETVEYPPGRQGLSSYYRALQELAQDELTRRGEPPRSQPRATGIRGLWQRMFD